MKKLLTSILAAAYLASPTVQAEEKSFQDTLDKLQTLEKVPNTETFYGSSEKDVNGKKRISIAVYNAGEQSMVVACDGIVEDEKMKGGCLFDVLPLGNPDGNVDSVIAIEGTQEEILENISKETEYSETKNKEKANSIYTRILEEVITYNEPKKEESPAPKIPIPETSVPDTPATKTQIPKTPISQTPIANFGNYLSQLKNQKKIPGTQAHYGEVSGGKREHGWDNAVLYNAGENTFIVVCKGLNTDDKKGTKIRCFLDEGADGTVDKDLYAHVEGKRSSTYKVINPSDKRFESTEDKNANYRYKGMLETIINPKVMEEYNRR